MTEQFSFSWILMDIAKSDRVLIHAAQELGGGNTVSMVANQQDLHEVPNAGSSEKVNDLVVHARHGLSSCEREIHSAFQIENYFVPKWMTLVELLALISEAVDPEVGHEQIVSRR